MARFHGQLSNLTFDGVEMNPQSEPELDTTPAPKPKRKRGRRKTLERPKPYYQRDPLERVVVKK